MQELKSDSNFKTPIIVVTANTVDGAKTSYLNAGFDEFIAKPINRELLDQVLDKYLNN